MTPFTWSWSRHRTLEACPRRYWLSYYGARGGWRPSADERARALYRMRRLLGRAQWVGLRVHELLAGVLERARLGDEVDEQTLVADLVRRGRREIADARAGLAALDPRRKPDFEVLFYEGDPGDEVWEAWLDELEAQARAALGHPVLQRLREVPERIREVERLEPLVLDGVRALVSLDVLVADERGGLVAVDWKTGSHEDVEGWRGQLGLYSLYVQRRYRVGADRVEALVATTRLGGFQRLRWSPDELTAVRRDVVRSARAMSRLLEGDGDRVDETRCPKIPEGSAGCVHCGFRRACGREADI